METEKKYSSEGRVLRPRRKGPSSDAGRDGGHRSYENKDSYSHQGYQSHEGGYQKREGGYHREGGYQKREGGYKPREEGGERRSYGHSGYQSHEGGYQKREGGYHREGGYQKREGGYQSREGGYQKREGGYKSHEGGYQKREGAGQLHEGGYQKREGFQKREGGYQSREGGYQKREGGFQKKGGYQQRGSGHYGKRYEPQFSARDEAGIDRMLTRKTQADIKNASEREVPDTFQEEIRLNKFIANSGVCSRREADTYIQAGVVTVNGEVVTELGTKINVLNDEVKFNGERLKGEEKVYIVMNKPKGYVTTASDPHADKTVMDLIKGCTARVFPVGRLDKATTGVLMFTNDGAMAERLTHPSFDKKKIYQVLLDHPLREEDYDRILAGIVLSDGEIKADELEFTDESDHRKLGIEIHSGKNRIVRRIFESLGYEVKALDRVYFAGLTKKGLQKGEWRYLSEGEVNILKMGAYM